MDDKIIFKNGLKADLPLLDEGEPGFTTDSGELYIGNGTENIKISKGNIEIATVDNDGLMSKEDKIKLENIETRATKNTPSLTMPKMNGVATVGVEENFARGDHIHSSDTTKLDKSGGKLTGMLEAKNDTSYETAQVRNIYATTTDITTGAPLANGCICLVYE